MPRAAVTKKLPVSEITQELMDSADKLPGMVDSKGYVLLKKNHGNHKVMAKIGQLLSQGIRKRIYSD